MPLTPDASPATKAPPLDAAAAAAGVAPTAAAPAASAAGSSVFCFLVSCSLMFFASRRDGLDSQVRMLYVGRLQNGTQDQS